MEKAFGEGLRELRASKRISQERLAELTDYKRTNLSMIENGSKSPSKELIKRIAKALSVPYEPLFALKIIDKLTQSEQDALFEVLEKRKALRAKPKN